MEFEDAGANSWVTSESYLEEERLDGGLGDGKTKDFVRQRKLNLRLMQPSRLITMLWGIIL